MNFFKKKPDYQPKATEIQIPLVTINPYGNILFSNNSANNLFQVHNAVNKNITDFIKSDLPSIITGSSNSVRKAFAVALPEEKFVEITSKEVQSENYFILTFMEVTKDYVLMNNLIEYRTNMDNLGKNKNLFLAQMSNAFKSPLHSIMGYSQAILEGMGGETDEKQKKYLSIMYKDSEELFKLLDRVTELSKIEAQMISFSYKGVIFRVYFRNFAPIKQNYVRRIGKKNSPYGGTCQNIWKAYCGKRCIIYRYAR